MEKKRQSLFACLMAMLLPAAGFSQVTQTEMTFQPDGCRGKDAYVEMVNGLPAYASNNYGSSSQLLAMAWTFNGIGGTTGFLRTFIDFTDLQSIPQGTHVNYAYLSLYGVPTSGANDLGSYGSNACYVQRVTSAWDESTVTWNNQPATTTTNQVTLPGSNGVQWNYHVIDLNITTLLQDIINLPPAQRYGLCVRLQSEVYYRSMLFTSSENTDATRHPKLRIGLNYCSASAARETLDHRESPKHPTEESDRLDVNVLEALDHRESPKHPPTEPGNRLDVSGKSDNGLKALVKTNLSANQVTVDYELPQDGKAVLQIVSYDGVLLKSVEVDGTKGKHNKTIILDAPLLKNKMAVLVIKQGNNKTSSSFMIAQ